MNTTTLRRQRNPLVPLLLSLACASLARPSSGQCPPQWLPGDGFDMRGSTTPAEVHAFVEMPNGDLVAGGVFTQAGGVAVNNIARWNGSSWSPLGSGIQGPVNALAVLPSGDLVAGGAFTLAGGVAASNIARWDGAAWSPLGSGVSGQGAWGPNEVQALTIHPTSQLIVGGRFDAAGGIATINVASWNGSWSAMSMPPLSPISSPGRVTSLAVRPNGQVVAGTQRVEPGVSLWSGTGWSVLYSGVSPFVGLGSMRGVATLANGDILAGGSVLMLYPSLIISGLIRWDGSTWSSLATVGGGYSGFGSVNTLTSLPNGDLVVGGAFNSIDGVPALNLARWNGTQWSAFGNADSTVNAFAQLGNGVVAAGGLFGSVAGEESFRIARWGCDAGIARRTPYGTACDWLASSFYEHFPDNTFDLSNSTLQMTLSPTGYDVVHVPGTPTLATPQGPDLGLGDDDVTAPIALPFSIPYPGGTTNTIWLGSNGSVFLQPAGSGVAYYGFLSSFLGGVARHAALFGDQDPATGTGAGTIHVDIDPVAQVVYATWLDVQQYGAPAMLSTFQVALGANGTVQYRYLSCQHSLLSLVGWTPGNGAQDPTSRDLSASGPFGTTSVLFRMPIVHAVDHRPWLGSTITLTTSRLDPGSLLGLNLIGFTKFDPGIDLTVLGMPRCFLHTSLDLLFPFFPVAQSGSLPIVIPNQPSLIGTELHAQGLAWDFPVNPFGMVSSNGLTLTIGNL